ncbi:Isoleucine--tRNA ligase [Candidatus Hepatoplasma crinochetorum Av]|uniref:Isoleucine--tRNA ligase n=2 Tax=Candidatus Hepatoplasma crinochetorum TaxID=295596 RepID=W8GMW0_9MOLU|nr:Isoleucine--tRNA ligase [Candidatus Hepatoplasma crinochetorum Av]
MPKTDFEMKGNLPKKDGKFILFWEKNLDFKNNYKNNQNKFILHDGPPYANGDLHLGHAVNKILKDVVIRHNLLLGKKVEWKLGWDTHGLPIEVAVKKMNLLKKVESNKDFLDIYYSFALEQVNKQQEQFRKFALYTNFKDKYLTLDKNYETKELEVFFKMFNKGFIYQDFKPVYWSWSSKTALAEAEVEYQKIKEEAIFVAFKLKEENLYFVIWTTTPWSLAANVAIAFNPKINYVISEFNKKQIVIAKDLIPFLNKKWNTNLKILKNIDLNKYFKKELINPLNKNNSFLIKGNHVTIKEGTGLVHTAGGHGLDDFIIVKENNLPIIVVVDEIGKMINAGKYNDLFYQKASKQIIIDLEKENNLIFKEEIEHSIPIDWRTKKSLIYRATKQWFVSIHKIKNSLIKELDNVNWYPEWGKNRLTKMIENREDWCISRQRIWGVPIPIIYDQDNKVIKSIKLQQNILKIFKKSGKIAWYNEDIESFLPSEIKYNNKMRKETDILDVWFDSGSSHNYVLGKIQADLYLEGNDQYRGWFNSSLITSFIKNEKAPYKNIFTHGFVVDDKNNKMSKSLNNGISPLKIIEENGIDILRLWVLENDYFSNLKYSKEILQQIQIDYRKIRNTIRFLLGNLNDFKKEFLIKDYKLSLISKMIIYELNNSQSKINQNNQNYNYYFKVKEIINQLNTGFISYYLDYIKDVVYIEKQNSNKRIEGQFILKKIFDYIIYNFASIIPVTIEEAYQSFIKNQEKSIFQTIYPKFILNPNDKKEYLWKEFNLIRSEVNKEIEKLRLSKIINRSQEAKIEINLPSNLEKFINKELKNWLMVGEIKINPSRELKVKAEKFKEGIKCSRCWKLFKKEQIDGDICLSCKEIINGN